VNSESRIGPVGAVVVTGEHQHALPLPTFRRETQTTPWSATLGPDDRLQSNLPEKEV
jgi:hypothetical protein